MKCPISEIPVIQCPVTSCMWHNNKCERNCALLANNTHEIEVAEAKGFSIVEGYRETAKAKKNIIRVIILDNYIEWYKETGNKHKARRKKYRAVKERGKEIQKLSILNKENRKVFKIGRKEFCGLCQIAEYEDFIKSCEIEKAPELHIVLGIRKNLVIDMQVN